MASTPQNSTALAESQSPEEQAPQAQPTPELRGFKVRSVSMKHGWYWLIEGFALWVRSPAFLSYLTFGCILSVFAALLVPYIGELLGFILMPGLILGVFNGCRAIDRKRRLSPGLLFSGFRRRAYDLLLAGFLNFVVTKLVLLSTILIDGGAMWRLSEYVQEPDTMTFISPQFMTSIAYTTVACILWGMAYLFVPQLIGWWRLSAFRALGSSIRGCLRNTLPFIAYLFCFGFFICVLAGLVINLFSLTMEGLGPIVCVGFVLIMAPSVFASFYVAARDIYGLPRRRKRRRHATPEEAPQEAPPEATPEKKARAPRTPRTPRTPAAETPAEEKRVRRQTVKKSNPS
ncbi:MAG: hypothetical protein LBR05_07285 [Azoarcus sp.]|jgi:hypothetical protein|nr:hypothetical protein [Azoarcus sp.]